MQIEAQETLTLMKVYDLQNLGQEWIRSVDVLCSTYS